MSKLKIFTIATFVFLLCGLILTSGCQGDSAKKDQTAVADTPARDIPEMDVFLEVFKMAWHAQMEGDYQMVRDSAELLVTAGRNLAAAELPAFYDDVRADFEAKVESFDAAVTAFKNTAPAAADSALIVSLDEVRTAFVDVMVAVSVQIPEMDHFHDVLQPLWHEALPDEDYAAIKTAIPALKERADAIVNAQLPAKYGFLEEDFNAKRMALKTSIEELDKACTTDSTDLINDKMTEMHDAYHALTECLD